MKPIVFPKAGRIMLVEYGSDGSLAFTPDKMTTAAGVVQSVQPSVTSNTTDLPDGNSDWPMGTFETGKDGSLVVNMSSFQPALFARLVGSTVSELSGGDLDVYAIEEPLTVPSASPYTVNLAHSYKANATFVLVTKDNSPFTQTASAPAAGQFQPSGNQVTFNSADAGKEVLATYVWTATKGTSVGLPEAGSVKTLHAIISGEATTDDQLSTLYTNIIVDRCRATGDVAPPTMQREPQGWSFTLKVLKPRGGKKALDIKVVE